MYNRMCKAESIKESLKFQSYCEAFKMYEALENDKKVQAMICKEHKDDREFHAFIGINPPVGTHDMKSLYELCVAKLPFKKYIMCVEQNTDGGVRPHLHILAKVTSNCRKNHVITRLSKIFEVQNNSVDVSITRSYSLVTQWTKYIKGEKKEEKLENVNKDRVEREQLNIPHYYGNYEESNEINMTISEKEQDNDEVQTIP